MSAPKKDAKGLRWYGGWAGNPRGHVEIPEDCIEEVFPRDGYLSAQCTRKRGHGLNGEYCKQHAKRYPAVSP